MCFSKIEFNSWGNIFGYVEDLYQMIFKNNLFLDAPIIDLAVDWNGSVIYKISKWQETR